METRIEESQFGSITINGVAYDHDVVIGLSGRVGKRKKKLSKQVFGTSHIISVAEVRAIYETGCRRLILGSGHYGRAKLSEEAEGFLSEQDCSARVLPTPEAIHLFNASEEPTIGLFHVTC